jgi:hypothetical protein
MGKAKVMHTFNVAVIGLQLAQQQGEQTGLAAAVGTDKRQPLAGLQGGICLFQQQFGAAPQTDIA